MRRLRSRPVIRPRTILAIGATRGGVADVFTRAVAELRARGHTVEVLAVPRGGTPGWSALRAAWRTRRAIRGAGTVHIELGSNDAEVFWFALGALALRARAVVVLHDHPKPVHAPASALVPQRLRGPVERLLPPSLDRRLVEWLLRRSAVVVVFGERAADDWRARGARDVLAIPHGGEPADRAPAPPSEGESILFAGYIGPGKGVDVLFGAWRELRDESPLPLVLAGAADPPNGVWLDQLLVSLGPGPGAPRRLGGVAGEAAFREIIERAAVVVLPYRRSSPASGILVRAMHAGRAIVATPVPAVEAVLRDEENALLVPREDAPALAAAIRRLLREPATRDRLGAAAAATAAARFTWGAHAAGLERAYDRAAELTGRR